MTPEGMENADSDKAEDCAAMKDVIMGNRTSRLKKVSCLRQDLGNQQMCTLPSWVCWASNRLLGQDSVLEQEALLGDKLGK